GVGDDAFLGSEARVATGHGQYAFTGRDSGLRGDRHQDVGLAGQHNLVVAEDIGVIAVGRLDVDFVTGDQCVDVIQYSAVGLPVSRDGKIAQGSGHAGVSVVPQAQCVQDILVCSLDNGPRVVRTESREVKSPDGF